MNMHPSPASPDAEIALVAAALRSPEIFDDVDLDASAFTLAAPRALWNAAKGLREAGQAVDVITAMQAVSSDAIAASGGLGAFRDIALSAASIGNASAYASLIRDKAIARQVLAILAAGIDSAHDNAQDAAAAVASRLDALLAGQDTAGPLAATHALDNALDAIRRMMRGEARTMTPTGFVDVDRLLGGGLEPGQLCLVGARPGVGKSALAAAIAAHCAMHHGQPALFVSLEMPSEQIVLRLAAADSHVNLLRARTGRLTPDEYRRLEASGADLARAPLFMDYSPSITLAQIAARARRLKREQGGLGVIVVDYLQLMPSEPGSRADSRHLELARLSRGLKVLAGELATPVVALSQLSRGAVSRERPAMSDLRDSGGLESDADIVALLWRSEQDDSRAEVILAKQRNGPTGAIDLHWDGPCAAFRDAAQPWQGEQHD